MPFCQVFVAAYTVNAVFATKFGLGRHLASLSHYENVMVHKFIGISSFFNVAALAISKTSFALTLLRLAPEPWQRRLIWGVIATTNLFLWTTGIFIFSSCTPFERIWDSTVEGTCWDRRKLMTYNIFTGGELTPPRPCPYQCIDTVTSETAWSAAMDFSLAMFPWYLIWDLNMRTVEKLGLCIAMSLGILYVSFFSNRFRVTCC